MIFAILCLYKISYISILECNENWLSFKILVTLLKIKYIMRRLYIILFALIVASSIAMQSIEVTSTPGKLSELLQNDKNATALIIHGTIDVRDFYFIAESLPNLLQIDLSDTEIMAYNSNTLYFGSKANYEAGVLPTLCMFGKQYTTIILPSTLTFIDDGALSGCSKITKLQFPSTLTGIGEYALYDCDELTSIEIPANVKNIKNYAFAKCDKLVSVKYLASATPITINNYCFYNSPMLSSVTLAPNTYSIGAGAFASCPQLSNIDFPNSLALLSEEAFKATPLINVDLSKCTSLRTIGQWAFADNKAMKSIKLPPNIESIGNGAFFYNTSLSEITLPDGIKNISDFMLTGCSSIACDKLLTNNITEIGKYAFSDWSQMLYFYIPEKISNIGDNAFERCKNLANLDIAAITVPTLGNSVFAEINQPTVALHVPAQSYTAYKNAAQWKEFNVKSDLTDIEAVKDENIKVFFVNTLLNIEATSAIKEVRMYDFSGIELVRLAPNSNSTQINTETYFGNNYILGVMLHNGTIKQIKLARK